MSAEGQGDGRDALHMDRYAMFHIRDECGLSITDTYALECFVRLVSKYDWRWTGIVDTLCEHTKLERHYVGRLLTRFATLRLIEIEKPFGYNRIGTLRLVAYDRLVKLTPAALEKARRRQIGPPIRNQERQMGESAQEPFGTDLEAIWKPFGSYSASSVPNLGTNGADSPGKGIREKDKVEDAGEETGSQTCATPEAPTKEEPMALREGPADDALAAKTDAEREGTFGKADFDASIAELKRRARGRGT